jgi:hypothetical protein
MRVMPEFPQHVCPRGETGECAFVSNGLNMRCSNCQKVVARDSEEGEAIYQYYFELKCAEGETE